MLLRYRCLIWLPLALWSSTAWGEPTPYKGLHVISSGAERYVVPSDYLYLYNNRAVFEGDAFGWSLRREAGFTWEKTDRANELKKALGIKTKCGCSC